MKKNFLYKAVIALMLAGSFSSCSKDDSIDDGKIQPYDVPKTYNFTDANYATSSVLVKQMLELDAYLRIANSGTALDGSKATNYFNNTNNPFTESALNTSGLSLSSKTADAPTFKGYIDNLVTHSKITTEASNGKAGYIVRGTAKIIVGADGLENGQAVSKGMMGSLFFKQAMDLLTSTKTDASVELQKKHWDEAFGLLAVPANYDSEITYESSLVFPAKPAYWGGYLAERGKNINAGKIIFDAFLKGRAAIGANDKQVRDEQVTIIQNIWEKLAANAAYNYVYSPTLAANAGNLGTQFHAISEAYGFIEALKYRAGGSKLSAASYNRLKTIISTNGYTLINEAGYSKLKEAQEILKSTYELPSLN